MTETMQTRLRLLVIDDEESIRHMLSILLKNEGYAVRTVDNGEEGLKELISNHYDLVLCDVRMPKMGGMELLDELSSRHIKTTMIVMSAFGNRQMAIEAIKRGAYDYIDKPFQKDEILLTLAKAVERLQLRQENERLKARSPEQAFEGIVGTSEVMQNVFATIKKVAPFDSTVLIHGESGTGKELVARAIHALSPRRDGPWIPVNCGAIPDTLLESELFGHVKGAFTDAHTDKNGLFIQAHKGTLLLDEIAELPASLQVKLLRVLQEGQVRRVGDTKSIDVQVRVIAASLKDLRLEVEAGRFREDLFYRLNVIQVFVPSLRERKEDIPMLIEHFLAHQNKRLGTKVKGLTPEAHKIMMDYNWPGNVRELQNTLERGVVLAHSDMIDETLLPDRIRESSDILQVLFRSDDLSIKRQTAALERNLIARALERTKGNRTNASKLLEISHRALLYKIKDYKLDDK